jgi:Ras family protein
VAHNKQRKANPVYYQQGTDDVPTMIVGHRIGNFRPEMRQVSEDEGNRLAEEMRCGWIEASARYDENVTEAFEGLLAEIQKMEHEDREVRRCSLM